MQTIPTPNKDSNNNPPRGGQASLGLFGCGKNQCYHSSRPIARPHTGVQSDTYRRNVTLSPAQIESFVEYDEAQTSNSAQLCVIMRQDKFVAMIRLNELDQRPVREVVAEWLRDCRTLMGGCKSVSDPHGDCPPERLTNAMRLAQIQADERERYGMTCEEAYEAHCAAGTGYVEIALALER